MKGQRVRPEDFGDCQLRMTILRGLPLNYWEHAEVQRSYYCFVDPRNISFSNTTTLRERIIAKSISSVDSIRTELHRDDSLNSLIGLQVDGWSQPNSRTNYFATIAHWITDKMEWREALLAFSPTEAQHKGRQLASILRDVIGEYQVADRVSTITSDNASPNATMTEALNEESLEYNLSSRSLLRIPCLSHVIQLAQGALLDGIKCRPTNEEIVRDYDDKDSEVQRQQTNYGLRANPSRTNNSNRGDGRAGNVYGEIPLTLWKVSLSFLFERWSRYAIADYQAGRGLS